MKINSYVENSILLAIGLSYDKIWRDLNRKLKEEHCNLTQALVLISIFFENSDQVTPSQLAKAFQTTRANISQSITHLEKSGFLKRVLDPSDARSYKIVLKPEGRKAVTRLIKIIDGLENFFEKSLGKKFIADSIHSMSLLQKTYRNR